jgi:SAM-dependent methyltransferase
MAVVPGPSGDVMARLLRHSADFPELGAITPADTVVDVGCGLGGVCVAAGELGAEVIAIDCDPGLVEHTAERMRGVPARAFRGVACRADEGIPLPDGTASVVVCTEVLEHVPEPARFLAELARIGRPGARYLISVPDPASEALMRFLADPAYFEFPGHINVFGHGQLDRLIADAGLMVERRPSYPNNFYWAVHALLRAAAEGENCHPVGRMATPDAPKSPPTVVEDWNRVWRAIEAAPLGGRVQEHLDALLPRSQVVIARKPASHARKPHLFRDLRWKASKLKGYVKDGCLRLGGFEVGWNVRRRPDHRGSHTGSPG